MPALRTLAVNALRLTDQRTAAARYIRYLVHQWSDGEVPFHRIVLFAPFQVPLELFELRGPLPVETRSFGERAPAAVWEQALLPREVRGVAVLFCPAYTAPLSHDGPIVLANHGIHEVLPGEVPWRQRVRAEWLHRRSARRAERVIANSQWTKADLVKHHHVHPDRIDVVYPAAQEVFFEPRDEESVRRAAAARLGTPAPFVLFVGKLLRRRHVPALIEAFARVRAAHGLEHHLLIIGPPGHDVPVAEAAARHGVQALVHHVLDVDQEELALLYTGADVFVLPSLYEGLSWAMLEAMASGTAVLTVDNPTLAEEAADAVVAVPTPSVADLAAGLERLLTDPALRRDYEQRGRARAAHFSPHETARATAGVLDRVARAADA